MSLEREVKRSGTVTSYCYCRWFESAASWQLLVVLLAPTIIVHSAVKCHQDVDGALYGTKHELLKGHRTTTVEERRTMATLVACRLVGDKSSLQSSHQTTESQAIQRPTVYKGQP